MARNDIRRRGRAVEMSSPRTATRLWMNRGTLIRRRAVAGAFAALFACVVVGAAVGGRGGVDPTFAGDGTLRVDFGASESASGVAVQPDGKILVGGSRYESARAAGTGFLLRLTPDGATDASFAGDGRVDIAEAASGGAITRQPDGKIVYVGGRYGSGQGMDFFVARFNVDGTLDGTFGSGGAVTTDVGGGSDFPFAVLVSPDGRIVVAGQTTTVAGTPRDSNIAVARYMPNGVLDQGFGRGGTVATDLGAWDVALDVALEASGKIVIAGYRGDAGSGLNGFVTAVRYTSDGSLDAGFGGDGIVVTQHPQAGHGGLVLQADNRPVLTAGPGLTVLRLTASGKPDPSFGGDGTAVVADRTAYPGDVALQPNGKIVVFGSVDRSGTGGQDFVISRFLPDGRLDASMSTTGTPADAGAQEYPLVVAVAADGRIVGGGISYPRAAGESDAAIVRYLPGTCSVPTLKGTVLRDARAALAAANCRAGETRLVVSKRVKSGRVVAQSLPAGREAADWAMVNLAVSRGPR